jgi:RNA polymerase sigma-54 factor
VKTALKLGLTQQLRLTPQLAQAIRLLQLSRLELEVEIGQALESNPLLERADDPDSAPPDAEAAPGDEESFEGEANGEDLAEVTAEPIEEQGNGDLASDLELTWSAGGGEAPDEDSDEAYETRNLRPESLQDHLHAQLNLVRLSPRDRAIAEVLVAAVEDDGYLREPMDALQAALLPEIHAAPEEIDSVRHLLMQLDPVGAMTRDLRECLLAQIDVLPEDMPGRALARVLADSHLEDLRRVAPEQIAAQLRVSCVELEVATSLLRGLNPRPGGEYSAEPIEYVTPDILATKVDGRWKVALNPAGQPALRINRHYARMARAAAMGSARDYLREHLREARWLLKSLKSRGETLLKVAQAIVREQSGFLEFGSEAMRPLTLREVAQTTGLHESTVSRVTTRKYLATPRGTFELKHFFSSSLATTEGGAASSHAIRAMIKKLVADEGHAPLSDQAMADALKTRGIAVARRTVAKYREAMNIPPSSERGRPG